MNNKLLVIGVVVAILLSVVSFARPSPSSPFGGTTHFSGPLDSKAGYLVNATSTIGPEATTTFTSGTYSNNLNVYEFVQGGATTTLTVATTTLLTAANVCDGTYLAWSPNGAGEYATMTPPAATEVTSYANCLDTDGDERVITIENSSTTAKWIFATTSVNAATGTLFYVPRTASSTLGTDDPLVITGNEIDRIILKRIGSGSVRWIFDRKYRR